MMSANQILRAPVGKHPIAPASRFGSARRLFLPSSILLLLSCLGTSGCATRTVPPAVITAAVPATCPHPGIIWGAWSEITIGALVKNSRVRECRACGWVQIQSELKPTPAPR